MIFYYRAPSSVHSYVNNNVDNVILAPLLINNWHAIRIVTI